MPRFAVPTLVRLAVAGALYLSGVSGLGATTLRVGRHARGGRGVIADDEGMVVVG